MGVEWSYQHPRSGEWAHDVRDPLAEAAEVFVAPAAAGRPPRAGETLRIVEIGFGRGVNTAMALRALHEAGTALEVDATGYEPYPERLAPWPPCPAALRPWAPWWGVAIGLWSPSGRGAWRVEVRRETAARGLEAVGRRFDWFFLDLFSPARHPEDWEPDLFAALRGAAAPGAVLTSYCTARSVREGLQAAGWAVERLRHPARRQSLRALFPLARASAGG